MCLSEHCPTCGAEFLPSLTFFPTPQRVAKSRVSVCIQGETNALKNPMGNVLCGVKISFKNKANAHCIPSLGGCVHRRPEGILKEREGKKDTEQCLKYNMKLETRRASSRADCLQKFTFLL